MVIYPVIGFLTGNGLLEYPIFGVAPCPVTIFTFGLLLWTDKKVPLIVVLIPLVWSLLGFIPIIQFGILADIGLIISGIVGFIMIRRHNIKIARIQESSVRD
jgi:hypothetical protein